MSTRTIPPERPLLSPGSYLKDKWLLLQKIGGGGFGEIYQAKDLTTGRVCAVKAESSDNSRQVLRMEVLVLKRLQGIQQVCEFLGCGKTGKVNYLVMTLLGPNLSELRKRQKNQVFSMSTVLRLAVQILRVVQAMHNCGFLHRDLKPSNFAMGIGEYSRTCFLLDFGLSRQYIMPTGELKQPRSIAGFRGTVRYASTNAHAGHELGRHDDLWSVFYLLVELATGNLPWKHIREKEEVGKAKSRFNHQELISLLPNVFMQYLDHLKQLTYYDKPNYSLLIDQFELAQEQLGINQLDLFDWEEEVSTSTSLSEALPPPQKVEDSNDKVSHQSSHTVVNSINNVVERTSDEPQVLTPADEPRDNVSECKRPHHHVEENVASLTQINAEPVASQPDDLTAYIIPLPTESKPDGYFCASARKRRFVKCPDVMFVQKL